MAKRNTSGSSSGRRGSSRNEGQSSGGRKSGGKPFKKSGTGTGRSSSFNRDEKGGSSFKKRDDSEKRPYKKREEGSSDSRGSFGARGRSSDSRKPPFRKSDSGDSRSSGGARPYKKFDKPYGKREEGSSDSKRSFGSRGRSSDSGESRSSAGGRPYKKFDKPYEKREGRSDSGKSFGSRGRSSDNFKPPFKKSESGDSRTSGSARPYKKFDKPYGKKREDGKKREGSSDESKPYDSKRSAFSKDSRGRGKSFKKGNSNDAGGRVRRQRMTDGYSAPDGPSKPPRDESTGEEPKGFFKKSKTRYGGSSGGRRSQDESSTPAQTDKIRLNRFIANSGVCSRREADELITMGVISVNGKTITELGYKVNPGDEVRYENKILKAEKPVYILMNKPKGYLTTTEDPQERNTVMHILGGAVKERVYPVGRLDRNTTGLLLLTNDGDLADKLMHPSYNVKKIYKVELDRPLTKADFQTIIDGVQLEEGRAKVDDLAIVSEDGKTVGVEIHIGWNRVIRRIFESLSYDVVRLDRSVYAGLDKKDLGRGHWRFLTKEELVRLKHYK